MASPKLLSDDEIVSLIKAAGLHGMAVEAMQLALPDASRSTLNRRLAGLVAEGRLKRMGAGRATSYAAVTTLSAADIQRYFEQDPQTRPIVRFKESLLEPDPGLDPNKAKRLSHLMGLASPLDQRFLSNFLIDFSWASSVLEGATYSSIDTEALIQYGERNKDKPIEDGVLILCHKEAIEHLWRNRELTLDNLCVMQSLLTDSHNVAGTEDSDHFLPAAQRGRVREYEEVNLGRSAYQPPFRPGKGFIEEQARRIVETAGRLPPIESAFYLMTRIPYLQVFANGNKRTARLAANLPLLGSGLLPVSFVDFNRAEYIRGMSAFYELESTLLMEQVFMRGYVKSIIRSSSIPPELRAKGFDLDAVAEDLLGYVVKAASLETAIGRAMLKVP